MNRPIRFRAWDAHRMLMTYSDTVPSSEFRIQSDGSWWVGMIDMLKQTSYIMESTVSSRHDCVLMQYTGINDKNGVGIYEGDILRRFNSRRRGRNSVTIEAVYVVRWADGAFWVQSRALGGVDFVTPQLLTHFLHADEVIGNIYEHPELMKAVA